MTQISGDNDKTCVQDYSLNTERYPPICVSNQCVKTCNNTGGRHPIADDILSCCKCAQRRSSETNTNTAANIHRIRDDVVENGLTEKHVYESVKHRINQHPCTQTCGSCLVSMGSPSYLHPVSQVQSKHEHELIHLNSDINCCRSACSQGQRNDFQHVTTDSSYACVDHFNRNFPLRRKQRKCISSTDKYKYFRKGFYILLVLNVIFLLLNVVGLPFLYVATETQRDATVQEYKKCLKCDIIHKLTSQEIKDLGIIRHKDGQCCVKNTEDLLAFLIKGWTNQQGVQRNYKLINKLLTRRRSAIHLSGHVTNAHIVWRSGGVTEGTLTYDEHGIHVNTGGTYVLYSTIGFKKGPCHSRRRIGYTVKLKGDKGSPTILAAVQKLCLNGINYEQDFVTQTVFQVPMGQKREVFIDIAPVDYECILKHHPHTFSVFEI
ncbi:uncharacterized protein LOC123555287 isoform X2 [Mercenaria mercenaria]|nr:uncharacterized protein LOC123555287 isoform X2 [Mercenaria mercenaria]